MTYDRSCVVHHAPDELLSVDACGNVTADLQQRLDSANNGHCQTCSACVVTFKQCWLSACRSTAVEVALKMGMRKFVHDRPGIMWKDGPALHVMGLTNGYHGDTLGAMDAVAQSPYNNFDQTPW